LFGVIGVIASTTMKIPLLALVVLTALAYGEQLSVYVNGAGDKWYSAWELEQIARDYARQRKIQFSFEGAERSVWVRTSGSNIIASVSFSSGMGKPIFMVDIDRSGKVATNHLWVAFDRVEGPGYVDLSRTNRLQRTPR
jgi:hypothetical protein